MPQIYVCLEFVRRIFFSSTHLLQSLATEMAAFVSLQLLCRRRLCFWMHSDVHFCGRYCCHQSLCHSFRLLVTCRDLSFAHFYFSRYPLPFRVVYFAFLPARASKQGNVIALVSVYIYIYRQKIVIERTRDLIYLKFVATDFSPKIISPSAGENSVDLA